MSDKKWDLVALASIPVIMTLGNSMLIPILPQIERELKVSSFKVSMLITVYAVVAILLIPLAGYLSDRFGRKAVIIPSLVIAAVGGGVAGAAAWMMEGNIAYWTILAGRFLQGIGAAGAFPIVIPLVGDMFKDEDQVSKSLGIIETSNTFGKVLSPILGAALAVWLWYSPFLAVPVLCLFSLLLVIFLVKTPKRHEKPPTFSEFIASIRDVLKQKGRWLYALFAIGGICMFLLFGVLYYLSETLESEFALKGVVKGLVLAIPLAALCLASFFTGKWIGKNKSRMKWLGFTGLALVTVSLGIIGMFDNIYVVVGLFTLGSVGIGAALPCLDTLITEGVDKKQRGTITALFSSMRFIGVSLGPPVVSLLIGAHHFLLFGILAASGASGALLTLLAVKPDQGGQSSSEGDRKQRHQHEQKNETEPAYRAPLRRKKSPF
ncbi:MFS transporter [Paenibacillus barcinonensis]|uniref:ACDE family multidrug resistance protein n=1 Tax=Paenibacillus barcinonensis TaxID=198119 RepID=A0A2V4WUJ6_PAEBA|nr:MFS transporter [Paenibacillus barcinonensis]PYE52287.1 ACDE family multidrug resistance protein [Paenibacillus barcinonensis]QKS59589.1 MFS transporter [Paenibacillus barcinonensis]